MARAPKQGAPDAAAPGPTAAEIKAEVEVLMRQLREICSGHDSRALMAALAEMYALVVSQCIHQEPAMEEALAYFQTHVRGWWLADRGGQFHVS